jgi:hypothetical protein
MDSEEIGAFGDVTSRQEDRLVSLFCPSLTIDNRCEEWYVSDDRKLRDNSKPPFAFQQ